MIGITMPKPSMFTIKVKHKMERFFFWLMLHFLVFWFLQWKEQIDGSSKAASSE